MIREQMVEEVIRVAQEFLGVQEEPENRGVVPDFANWWVIRDWRNYPLGGKGAPWCSSWVSLVGRLALGAYWPLPVSPWVSNVQTLAEWGKQQGILVTDFIRGDLLCVAHDVGWGHVALITGSTSEGKATTIEGNSNTGGSFNGNGVYKLVRTVRSQDRVLRWTDLLENRTGPLG